MTRKKVVFLVPSLGGGGAERATLELVAGLDELEVDITVAVDKTARNVIYNVPANCHLVNFESSSVLSTFVSLRRLVRALRPDAVYTALPHLNFVTAASMVAMRSRPFLATSVHNNMSREFVDLPGGSVWKRVTPWVYSRADLVICVSEGVRQEAVSSFGARPSRTVVVPNPVNIERIRRLAEQPVDHKFFNGETDVVVSVGRLVPQKNYTELLDAFSTLNRWRPRTRLLIVGDGPELENLRLYAARSKLDDVVDFIGAVENPFAYMKQSSVLALSSVFEGFGMVLAEAQAVGVPTVAADCDFGPSEVLNAGEAGLLYRPGRSGELASKLLEVLVNVDLRSALVVRGAKNVMKYDAGKVAAELSLQLFGKSGRE